MAQDTNNAETLLAKMNKTEYYGDDQEEHLLAALSRITYHLKRQKNETARQFLAKWESAERKVRERNVELPAIYRGFLLINALALSDNEIKTLLTFTQGSIEPSAIRTWLRKHETKLQASHLGTDTGNRSSKATSSTAASAVHHLDSGEHQDSEDPEIAEMEALLTDLTEIPANPEEDELGTFDEDEAAEILAVMLKEKKKTYTSSRPRLRRTASWVEGTGKAARATARMDHCALGRTSSASQSSSSGPDAVAAGALGIGRRNARCQPAPPRSSRPTSWRSSSMRPRTRCSAITWTWT